MSPRSLPAGVQVAVSTDQYRACLAVEIGTVTPIRVTNNPAGITIGGNPYTPGFLMLGQTVYDDQPAISIRIANTGNEVTAQDLDGTPGGGLISKTLKVYQVTYDSGGSQLTEEILYSGVVADFVADGVSGELVGTLAELCAAGMVGIITSRLCPYKFKGARCGYGSGETWCDHTYARCTALSNTARNGAFRTMPTLNTRLQYYLTEWVPGAATFGTSVPGSTPNPPPATGGMPRVRLRPAGPGVTPGTGPPKGIPPGEGGETY